jgi:hypothetical protein
MNVFQELEIIVDRDQIGEFIANLESRMDGEWSRQLEREREVAARGRRMYCFLSGYKPNKLAAEVWLSEHREGLRVANVVPVSQLEISPKEYNAVLREFQERFLNPAALDTGAAVRATKPDLLLEDFLSPKALVLIKSFCRAAGRTVLDVDDVKRWNQFLWQAHRDGTKLPADTLERLLLEEEGLPIHISAELAARYNQGMMLLSMDDGGKKAA